MNANELRIGNYYDHNGRIEIVTTNVIREVWEAKRVWCKPIPLTEEWLINFGFKYSELDKDYRLFPCFEIQIIADCIENYVGLMFYTRTMHSGYVPIYISDKIEYVHQLQNLYFALTGTELIYTCR